MLQAAIVVMGVLLYHILPAKYPRLSDAQIVCSIFLSWVPITLSSHILFRTTAKTHQLICPECGRGVIGGKG